MNAPTTLDSLDVMPKPDLDAMFRSAVQSPPAKPAGPMPDGDAAGVAIVGRTSFWRRWFAEFAHDGLWQGKVFRRTDDDHATLVNKILPVGVQEIHANVYRGPSRFDDRQCIVLDYSKTSFFARKIRDEIREVAPGLYLGLVYWGEAKTPFVDFALDFNGR